MTATAGQNYQDMYDLSHHKGLHTVCAEADRPNIYECQQDHEAIFLLGGAVCTRRYGFCDIATGRPSEYDQDEPRRVAESVTQLELRCATITGVTRDDLPDGTAWLYAETCRRVHELNPSMGVELLVDDFRGHDESISMVVGAAPRFSPTTPKWFPGFSGRLAPLSATNIPLP